jgi:hypothetical protein
VNNLCSFVFEGNTRKRVPGGKEEGHPQAGTRAYHWYVEETDDAANEVMPTKTNEHQEG